MVGGGYGLLLGIPYPYIEDLIRKETIHFDFKTYRPLVTSKKLCPAFCRVGVCMFLCKYMLVVSLGELFPVTYTVDVPRNVPPCVHEAWPKF